MSSKRNVRVGIDVGGTHTKAVALDNETHEILGESVVMTTHDDEMGVAAGVIRCFEECLTDNDISPDDVVFIAHSTTQATNALLEGDVAKVGVLGMGKSGLEAMLAKGQTKIPDIDLGTGRMIHTCHAFLRLKDVNEPTVRTTIDDLKQQGAQVIVASKAFGVDRLDEELLVQKVADEAGMLVSVASDISKLYGLTRRTRTAAINGSILPKMMNTADSTEHSVRASGITVPLMIMRGDGGVMDVSEMKKRPVLTMLSGPAASVMGALMYLRASNGIYFEVGGTSTNIGVIKNGRPSVDYSIVGGHATYINSLDVRVLGVAGGSMVRASGGQLVDVGPRSAHIAGLKYSVYTPLDEIEEPELEFFSPKPGDPADYVRIKLKSGKRVTITNSCAANVFGMVRPEDYSYGVVESARACMQPLADHLGVTVEECARQILDKAYMKIKPVIDALAAKYRLDRDQMTLVGCGGGAAALLPYSAKQMDLDYSIPDNAEIISSIGVALAMIRDVVERVIPNPTTDDITRLKREAKALAIKNGAVPDSVEVQIEIDPQASRVTAIALGSTEVQATDLTLRIDEEGARQIAATSMRTENLDEVRTLAKSDAVFVFGRRQGEKQQVRLVDIRGFVKVQAGDGIAATCPANDWEPTLARLWDAKVGTEYQMIQTPDVYLCIGGKVLDFSNTVDYAQCVTIMRSELLEAEPDEQIILISAKADRQ